MLDTLWGTRSRKRRGYHRQTSLRTEVSQPEFLESRLVLASTLSIFESSVAIAVTLSGTEVDGLESLPVTGTITSDVLVDGAGNGTVAFEGADAALASGNFSVDFSFLGTASLSLQGVMFDLTSSPIATTNGSFAFDGSDAMLAFDAGLVTLVGTSGPLLDLLPAPGEMINFTTDPVSVALDGLGVTGTANGNPPSVAISFDAVNIPLDDVFAGLGVSIDGTVKAQGTAPATDTIGVYNPATATSFLRNSNSTGVADVPPFNYGIANWVPISGDWNGDGVDTIGVYNPATATFFLRNANNSGNADFVFNYGIAGWVPLAGDWNSDGIDTIGVYNPATATFFLRNSNSSGVADGAFNYGGANWTPLAGDWNGDGADTIGAFSPTTATFFLRNLNNSGVADVAPFNFGGGNWTPLAGDWDGDGIDTIGVVNPLDSTFYLRNVNLGGVPDISPFQYGIPGWVPLSGNWDGSAVNSFASFTTDTSLETLSFAATVAQQPPQLSQPSTLTTAPLQPAAVQSTVNTFGKKSSPSAATPASNAHDEVFRTLQFDEGASLANSLVTESGETNEAEVFESVLDELL